MKKTLITIAAFLFGFAIVNAQTPGGINVLQGGTGLTAVPNSWCLTGSTSPLHLYASPCAAGEPIYIAASSTLLRFGTTTDTLIEGTNKFYTDTRVATYIVGSTTIPKGTPTLGNVFLGNGSQWTSVATSSLGITGGATLSGGATNALTYWTSPTTVGATSSPVVGYITATSTTAVNGIMGMVNIGSTAPTYVGGFFGTPAIMQVNNPNGDISNNIWLLNTYQDGQGYSPYAGASLGFGNAKTVNGPICTTPPSCASYDANNFAALTFSGNQFSAFPGLPPDSLALSVSDGALIFDVSTSSSAGYFGWGVGPGYAISNYDMVLKNITGSITGSGFDSGLGLGTTSPNGHLAIEVQPTALFPALNIGSYSTITGARLPILIALPNGNIGISSSTPSNPLEVNGNTFLGGNLTVTGTVLGKTTLVDASTTNLTIGTNGYITPLTSTFLAVDGSHKIIATTTPLFTETEPLYTAASSTLGRGTPTLGNVLLGNGTIWTSVSTSSLGISGGAGNPSGSTGQLQFNNGGVFGATTTLVYATTTGHVGIGTTTPAQVLDIAQTSTTGAGTYVSMTEKTNNVNAKIGVINNGGGNSYPGIWFGATTPTVANYAFLASSENGYKTLFNSPSGQGMDFRSNNSNIMSLDSVGNMTIPTTRSISFGSNLTLYGDSTYTVLNTPASMGFRVGNVEKMTMLSNGNVGIGTTTPTSKLTVNGHIGTDGAIPTLTSAGTSPSITVGSTDTAGEITEGTVATGATITFASAYARKPFCVLSSEAGLLFSYVVASTTITITNIGALSSTAVSYHCIANDL